MSRFRPLAAVAAVALLAGCVTAQAPAPIAAGFDPKEAAIIAAKGTTRIDGHAFLKTPNGAYKNAVGEPVRLIPASAYARERFDRFYGGRKFVAVSAYPNTLGTDPAYVAAQRVTKADSNGRFSFDDVAPGTYYLATQIVWKDEAHFAPQGGAVWEMVTVTGKEERPIRAIVNGV